MNPVLQALLTALIKILTENPQLIEALLKFAADRLVEWLQSLEKDPEALARLFKQ